MYHKITRNATISVVQTVISALVLFLLYRYLINHLGPEELGLWSVILASTSVARLSDMGLTGSVVKFVARYRAQKADDQAAEVVQTAAISIALVMAVLVLAVYPLLDVVLKFAIPVESMPKALSILPWAVFSLWLGSVGGVFQSGLDGCQRVDIRNILMILGNVFFLIAAMWLVPRYGLVGLAIGQSAQGVGLVLASWILLRRELVLPWLPSHWTKVKFKEMFGYAINFQITSIALLLFEPITKLLMSRYGGLTNAAYFEMASQLIGKLRALIISANYALVPAVAELCETAPEKVRELYLKVYSLQFFVIVPFYAAVLIALPMISMLWIGRSEELFVKFGQILVVGWGLNNLVSTAYFFNLGVGDLKWNTIPHVVMALLNVLLGFILGSTLGGLGVVISAMTSLVIASALVLYFLHKRYVIPCSDIVPPAHYALLLALSLEIAISLWVNAKQLLSPNVVVSGMLILGMHMLTVAVVMWFHPYRNVLMKKFMSRKSASIWRDR